LKQICAVLSGFGYEVWNSHLGTLPVNPAHSNLENCVYAASQCDLFLGIIRPYYGSGKVGVRSITHKEFLAAREARRPCWFMAHRDVTFARQLLKPYLWRKNDTRTQFKLKKNPVLDDLRVLDLYHDAIQNDLPIIDRRGHWAQEHHTLAEVLQFLDSQFKDIVRIRQICEEMNQPS
jgi:hypothetical protein